MKILFTNFHPRNGGGHVTYIMNLLQGLPDSFQCTVATQASSRLYRLASLIPGVRVVDLAFTTRPISWFKDRRALRHLIASEGFDIVHVNGSADHKQVMLALLGLRHRPRIIFTKHNDHPLNSFGHALRAFFSTDHVIAVSDHVKRFLLRSPYKCKPITTIRHGIDTDYFSPVDGAEKQRLRERLLGPDFEHKIVLGSSAGTDYAKGWLDLVAAVAALPSGQHERFHIVLIGDRPHDFHCAEVAERAMTAQVSMPGLLDDVRPWLRACDLGFVLSYEETLSFACRELMALGLPVLMTRVGGLPENLPAQQGAGLLSNSEGWVVPPRSPEFITKVLLELLQQPERLAQMGQLARVHAAQEFGLQAFVDATLAVYQDQV